MCGGSDNPHTNLTALPAIIILGLVLSGMAGADWQDWNKVEVDQVETTFYYGRVGQVGVASARNDGRDRVYVYGLVADPGSSGATYIYEYSWNSGVWNEQLVGLSGGPDSPSGPVLCVGDGRNDGLERIYCEAGWSNISEYTYQGGGWTENLIYEGGSPYYPTVGDGRGDGVTRLYCPGTYVACELTYDSQATEWLYRVLPDGPGYASSGDSLCVAAIRGGVKRVYFSWAGDIYEYQWNGSDFTRSTSAIASAGSPVWHLVSGDGRNSGTEALYCGAENGHVYEVRWTGSNWQTTDLGDMDGDELSDEEVGSLAIGDGRNDGVNRLYVGCSYACYELTFGGGSWLPKEGVVGGRYVSLGRPRGDGITRVYAADSYHLYECTWVGSAELPVLSNGYADPSAGDTNTDFYWYVDYYDGDGDPPSTKSVVIDGAAYAMTLYSGSPSNGTYCYGPEKLVAGDHNYYFSFDDGQGGSARLPSSGFYSGPPVDGVSPTGWQEQDKLLASDGTLGDAFGYSVSIDGSYAIAGAPYADGGGAAYVFRGSGTDWTQQIRLTASDRASGDIFGLSVCISEECVIVGAPFDDDNGGNCGSACVFCWDGTEWIEAGKLISGYTATDDHFGFSVSINESYAVAGAPGSDWLANNAGSVSLCDPWGSGQWLVGNVYAPDGAAGDSFGFSVASSAGGEHVIAGAPGDDDDASNSGSAYIWYRGGPLLKLRASNPAEDDEFGSSVSVCSDYAIVGAPYSDDHGTDSGSAYVFRRDGTNWVEQAILTASDGAAYDNLGWSVAISEDHAIVGAYRNDDNGADSGSVYVFKRNGTAWVEQAKLVSLEGHDDGDHFGHSVSISGSYVVVGAESDEDNGGGSGSAYVFEGPESSTSPVYRFWSPVYSRHFYTITKSEKDKLVNKYSHVWTYEGVAYHAFTADSDPDVLPVYRFWSDALTAHFYTISESEKNKLIDNYSDVWTFEGTAFYAYPEGLEPSGTSPVYRFWSADLSCHFYTMSVREKNKLIDTYSHVWTYEGIAWYAYE